MNSKVVIILASKQLFLNLQNEKEKVLLTYLTIPIAVHSIVKFHRDFSLGLLSIQCLKTVVPYCVQFSGCLGEKVNLTLVTCSTARSKSFSVCDCAIMDLCWHLGFYGFPGGADGKESACYVGELGLIPGLGKSPGGGHGNPLQYFCLENPHRQGSLAGYSPWGCKESNTTE